MGTGGWWGVPPSWTLNWLPIIKILKGLRWGYLHKNFKLEWQNYKNCKTFAKISLKGKNDQKFLPHRKNGFDPPIQKFPHHQTRALPISGSKELISQLWVTYIIVIIVAVGKINPGLLASACEHLAIDVGSNYRTVVQWVILGKTAVPLLASQVNKLDLSGWCNSPDQHQQSGIFVVLHLVVKWKLGIGCNNWNTMSASFNDSIGTKPIIR